MCFANRVCLALYSKIQTLWTEKLSPNTYENHLLQRLLLLCTTSKAIMRPSNIHAADILWLGEKNFFLLLVAVFESAWHWNWYFNVCVKQVGGKAQRLCLSNERIVSKKVQLISFGHMVAAFAAAPVYVKLQVQSQYYPTGCQQPLLGKIVTFKTQKSCLSFGTALHCSSNSFTHSKTTVNNTLMWWAKESFCM